MGLDVGSSESHGAAEMQMEEWIKVHGTTALKRAAEEGYDVVKGVGDHVLNQLTESLDLEWFESWEFDEERTSPTSESFGKRDLVQACVSSLDVPPGWSVKVSRISRIVLSEETKFTGVLVAVLNQDRVIRRAAFSFETQGERK